MESITQALQMIEKVLNEVSALVRDLKDKERLVTKVSAKVVALETRRSELEASLVKGEENFLAVQKKKGEDIITEAIKRAELKAASILSGAKAESDSLALKNDGLKKKVGDLEAL